MQFNLQHINNVKFDVNEINPIQDKQKFRKIFIPQEPLLNTARPYQIKIEKFKSRYPQYLKTNQNSEDIKSEKYNNTIQSVDKQFQEKLKINQFQNKYVLTNFGHQIKIDNLKGLAKDAVSNRSQIQFLMEKVISSTTQSTTSKSQASTSRNFYQKIPEKKTFDNLNLISTEKLFLPLKKPISQQQQSRNRDIQRNVQSQCQKRTHVLKQVKNDFEKLIYKQLPSKINEDFNDLNQTANQQLPQLEQQKQKQLSLYRSKVSRCIENFCSPSLDCIPSANQITFTQDLPMQQKEKNKIKQLNKFHSSFKKNSIWTQQINMMKPVKKQKENQQNNVIRKIMRKYVKGMPIQDKEEVKKLILVINNFYLENIKIISSMQYCYIDIPIPDEMKRKKEAEQETSIIKQKIKVKFNISEKQELYMFSVNGDFISTLMQLKDLEFVIIVSVTPIFQGIQSFPNQLMLNKYIDQLQLVCRYNEKAIEKAITSECKNTIEQRVKYEFQDIISTIIDQIFSKASDTHNSQLCVDTQQSNMSKPLILSKSLELDKEILEYYQNEVVDFKYEEQEEEKLEGIKENPASISLEKVANRLDQLLENQRNEKQQKSIAIKKIQKSSWLFNEDLNKFKQLIPKIHKLSQKKIAFSKGKFSNQTKIHFLQLKYRDIFQQNIPKIMLQTNLDRPALHQAYILFKALQNISSQRHLEFREGVDYQTYKNWDELAERIFNKVNYNMSGFLRWTDFLTLMSTTRAKTLKDKIDIFIKVADQDGNGMLSEEEIFNLCKICIGKYLKPSQFLDDLCNFFCQLIFKAVNINIGNEIPLETIKKVILEGGPDSDLLAMFCGADL